MDIVNKLKDIIVNLEKTIKDLKNRINVLLCEMSYMDHKIEQKQYEINELRLTIRRIYEEEL